VIDLDSINRTTAMHRHITTFLRALHVYCFKSENITCLHIAHYSTCAWVWKYYLLTYGLRFENISCSHMAYSLEYITCLHMAFDFESFHGLHLASEHEYTFDFILIKILNCMT